jgi:hypothetical protein
MKSICHIVLILLSSSVWAQNGQIKGKISDAENNEPLPFANILLDGTNVGTTSDLDGNFHLQGLSPGYQKLRISFIGYKTQITDDVFVSNTNIPFLEIQLETDESVLQEVVVKADPFRKKEEAPISMQSIGIKELESNPGSNRDISRVIQSFPGVGSTPAFRNDVIIRGGGPSETRFFLDDVEIPVINHFSTQGASGGPVGIINADFIQNVDFYSSSFPAAKYNALSGILDFKQKEGSKDKTNFQAALGASEASLTVDGPIGRSTSYIFSVRRSYLQFLFAALELPFLPTFNDYQLKVKTNIDSKNQVTLISIGSLDNLTLNKNIDDPDASQEYILSQIPVNNQWSYTIGSVYKHFFDHGYHTVVLSRNMLNNRFYKYPDNDESLDKSLDYRSTEAENKFRYELSARSGDLKINASTNLEYAKYTNRTAQQVFIDDSLNTLHYGTDLQVIKYGLSGQASKRLLNNRLLISLGVRFDGNTYNKSTSGLLNQTSPRFSMSYNIAENTAVKMSMGRYFQQSAYTTLGYRDHLGELVNKNTVKFIGLNQYNAGIEHTFDEGILISVEGFYKDYFQYPVNLTTGASLANSGADYSSVAGAAPVEFTGKGQAIGFEILNRWNYSMFTLLASYTYVRSQFSDINAELVPSSWDSKHLLTLTGSREFKRYWRIGFKWRFVGGLPYTPYDLATSSYVQAWNASGQPLLDYSKLNSERFSAFHQLDLRIDKNYFFTKWAIMLYLDIQNAYNFKNVGQDFITRERNNDRTYKTINNGSQYVLQSSPNKTGTILPTLGIMVKF